METWWWRQTLGHNVTGRRRRFHELLSSLWAIVIFRTILEASGNGPRENIDMNNTLDPAINFALLGSSRGRVRRRWGIRLISSRTKITIKRSAGKLFIIHRIHLASKPLPLHHRLAWQTELFSRSVMLWPLRVLSPARASVHLVWPGPGQHSSMSWPERRGESAGGAKKDWWLTYSQEAKPNTGPNFTWPHQWPVY